MLDNILEEMRGKRADALGPNDIPEEVQNKTPEELRQLVDIMDAHLKSLVYEDTGEMRTMSAI